MIERVQDLRYMRLAPILPDAFKLTKADVRTPMVNDEIVRLTANLTMNPPTFKVVPPKTGPEALARSSRLEKAAGALWKRLSEDAGKNLYRRMVDKAVESGLGVLKVLYRPDRWDIPKRKKGEDPDSYLDRVDEYVMSAKLPIAAKIVDTRSYYEWRDEDGIARVVEITQRRMDDLSQEFGKDTLRSALSHVSQAVDPDGEWSPGSAVTLIEYWDREWAVYIATSKLGSDADTAGDMVPLKAFKHGYGRVPYFTGIGQETSSEDPNFEALSVAFPVMYLVPFLDSLYTMWANIGFLTGYPTIQKKTPANVVDAMVEEDSDEEGDHVLRFEPGVVLEGPGGSSFEVLDFGGMATALTGMVAETKGMAQSAMLPSIMHGVPPGSRTAGYAIQELAAAAKAKYQVIVENIQRAISEAINFSFWLVEKKVRRKIYLLGDVVDTKTGQKTRQYLPLDPDDIRGYYACEVTIRPRNPVDRIQEGSFMANMRAAGLASRRQAIEEGVGSEQPDEIMEELLIEEVLYDDPEMRQLLKQKAMQKAGLGGLQQELAVAKMLQMQAVGAANEALTRGMPASNGMGAGQIAPGQPAVTADKAPQQMDIGGAPGQGMSLQNPNGGSGGQQPRIYQRKRMLNNPGQRGTGIEGFRSR